MHELLLCIHLACHHVLMYFKNKNRAALQFKSLSHTLDHTIPSIVLKHLPCIYVVFGY